jgi:alcohol dehydrogenase class IV
MAVVDPTAGGNPRSLTETDARELYERAFEGRLG